MCLISCRFYNKYTSVRCSKNVLDILVLSNSFMGFTIPTTISNFKDSACITAPMKWRYDYVQYERTITKALLLARKALRTINVTIFVPFKNGFNTVLWCCLHRMLNRSKVPFTKMVTLTAPPAYSKGLFGRGDATGLGPNVLALL